MALRTRSRLTAVLVAAVCVLSVAGVRAVRADPTPSLPPVPADRLLASTLESLAKPVTISGTVQTKLDLGLPDLPVGGGVGGPFAEVLGDQTFRVWSAPGGVRVSHILPFSERTLVANPSQAWSWDSDSMTATRLRFADVQTLLPQRGGDGDASWLPGAITGTGQIPSDADVLRLAGRVLAALRPYADVSVGAPSLVAGRPVYPLVLTPRSAPTLIGRVVVSIDARTRLPLRIDVFAKGSQDAAASWGFATVSFAPIDPAMFAFVPPAGATIKDADIGAAIAAAEHHHAVGSHERPQPVIFGRGFGTRVAVRVPGPSLPPQLRGLLPYGGPLFSAIAVERQGHTWLLAGPVDIDTLRQDTSSLT